MERIIFTQLKAAAPAMNWLANSIVGTLVSSRGKETPLLTLTGSIASLSSLLVWISAMRSRQWRQDLPK